MRFIKKSKVEIWSDNVSSLSPQEMNKMIERAGEISHRSHSRKSSREFIEMLRRLGHVSVLEHSWVIFLIRTRSQNQRDKLELLLLKENPLLTITNRGEDAFLVSGNARMFEEIYLKSPDVQINQELISFLHRVNPGLFPEKVRIDKEMTVDIVLNPCLYPAEEWKHRAMCVLFSNISRGFSHEMVRSRLFSFTQESTRYVNYNKKGLFFVLPYNDKKRNKMVIKLLFLIAGLGYNLLIRLGMKPENARQILPIGIRTKIVATANMKSWLHWFKIRTDKHAHWEIRWAACQLLREIEKRMPELNLNLIFEFHEGKDKIPYTTLRIKDEKHLI